MTFATLIIERAPLEWSGFVGAVGKWLGDAGLYAFLWLLLVGLSYFVVVEFRQRSPWGALHTTMAILGGLAAVCYVAFLFLDLTRGKSDGLAAPTPAQAIAKKAGPTPASGPQLLFSLAGLAALAACAAPIARDLTQKRVVFRRIWAIARVAIKEAWSRGIVWVCLFIPLIYLYADWYLTARPEDQLRSRVGIAYFSMSILFILTAVLLGAFSIPADLKSQNIFTIVTKPVERYEIVLGRFLGYAVLLLAELMVVTVVSYVYVVRGLTDQAVEESFHARVPLFGGELYYYNTGPLPGKHMAAENVGREWDYRGYIGVASRESRNQGVQFAIWEFDQLPAALLNRPDDDVVALEYSFDIFRTTTGQEGKDVYCTFTFAWGDLPLEQVEKLHLGLFTKEYEKLYSEARQRNAESGKRGEALDQLNAQSKKDIHWQLFEKSGIWQLQGIGVTDYHTQSEAIPAKVFKALHKRMEAAAPNSKPVMRVFVNVNNDESSRYQRVGVARADLYLLVEDRPFWINFFKGALCIYLITCVVLGLAVSASTYLTGIISLLMTALLFLAGLFLPFIRSLAEGRSEASGPWESGFRLAHRQTAALPLDKESVTTELITRFDAGFRWWLQFVMTVIPDVGEFYPADYVANGFDITWGTLLLLNYLIPVVGYLLPWGVLAYYLIKSREIANP